LIGPHIDWQPVDWWDHKLIFSYDHERQLNDPNQDGFVGATRALFERTQVDYQTDLRATSWLTLTGGFFYSRVNVGQERPFVSQAFGPQPRFVSDHTDETAFFAQLTFKPCENFIFVSGGRTTPEGLQHRLLRRGHRPVRCRAGRGRGQYRQRGHHPEYQPHHRSSTM